MNINVEQALAVLRTSIDAAEARVRQEYDAEMEHYQLDCRRWHDLGNGQQALAACKRISAKVRRGGILNRKDVSEFQGGSRYGYDPDSVLMWRSEPELNNDGMSEERRLLQFLLLVTDEEITTTALERAGFRDLRPLGWTSPRRRR